MYHTPNAHVCISYQHMALSAKTAFPIYYRYIQFWGFCTLWMKKVLQPWPSSNFFRYYYSLFVCWMGRICRYYTKYNYCFFINLFKLLNGNLHTIVYHSKNFVYLLPSHNNYCFSYKSVL